MSPSEWEKKLKWRGEEKKRSKKTNRIGMRQRARKWSSQCKESQETVKEKKGVRYRERGGGSPARGGGRSWDTGPVFGEGEESLIDSRTRI